LTFYRSLALQDFYVKEYTVKFCETANGDFVYPSSAAAREHQAEVIALFFSIELTEARIKTGKRFMFPVPVSTGFPNGWSEVRLKEYLRRPVGHQRAHLREVAVLAYITFMHENDGKGMPPTPGVTGPVLLNESDLVSFFRDEYWCKSAIGKQGVVAAMTAVDKAMGCATGWFVEATEHEPFEHLRTSMGHCAAVRCWVRISFGLMTQPSESVYCRRVPSRPRPWAGAVPCGVDSHSQLTMCFLHSSLLRSLVYFLCYVVLIVGCVPAD